MAINRLGNISVKNSADLCFNWLPCKYIHTYIHNFFDIYQWYFFLYFFSSYWLPTQVSKSTIDYLTPLSFTAIVRPIGKSAILTLAKCCQYGIKQKMTLSLMERPGGRFRSSWQMRIPGMRLGWRKKCMYCCSTWYLAQVHSGSDGVLIRALWLSLSLSLSLSQRQELLISHPFSYLNSKPILSTVPSFK